MNYQSIVRVLFAAQAFVVCSVGACSPGADRVGVNEGNQTTLQGLVTQAMAWRVKYRVAHTQPSGRAANDRFPIPIRSLGVHPNNRGGVYPSGRRCQNVCQEVLKAGFVKEEVNHAAVVVQETPREEVRDRGSAYVTGKHTMLNSPGKMSYYARASKSHATTLAICCCRTTTCSWSCAPF
jgi:hypothetical protein